MKVICKECKYEWNYTGKSKFYAGCPMCRTANKLESVENGNKTNN